MVSFVFFSLVVSLVAVRGAEAQVARGRLNKWDVREASGLVASRKHKGVLYTHNDSGDRNRIFAINEWGKYLGTYEIATAQARDWEDIAIGPGPKDGEDYLYIGDIGDNRAYYPTKVVYRVLEPNATRDPYRPVSEILYGVEKFEFKFPGHAGNANSETLMVDPHTGDLFIVRKTEQHPLQVFWAKAPLSSGKVIDLEEYHVTCVDYNRECKDQHHKSKSKGSLVGGDISPSGLGLLIKSYEAIYYWRRSSTSDSFFDSDPRMLPYSAERQGEAICWDAGEKGYFTLSEGRHPMLYYYAYEAHEKWVKTVDLWRKKGEESFVRKTNYLEDLSSDLKEVSLSRSESESNQVEEYSVRQKSAKRPESEQSSSLSSWSSLLSIEEKISSSSSSSGGGGGIEETSVRRGDWWEQWMQRSQQDGLVLGVSSFSAGGSGHEMKCHVLEGHFHGLIVAEVEFTSVSKCCEYCTQHLVHQDRCDTFAFCDKKEGCGLMQPFGTCLLKVVSEDPQLGLGWSFDPKHPWKSGRVTEE